FQLAVELLAHTQTPVSMIARRCGYKDPCTFSRAFNRTMGVSPLTHRNLRHHK
ncbi:MAG: helix-turn-helix domain-containing protein, partial [Lentisphaeria bacterium]|nr:helix-turn-helix domain-containing protein [Lentisphaeria bacterium]